MRFRNSAVLAAVMYLVCPGAGAATATPTQYPAKPIRLIVPQQAGSSNDTLSRVMANFLGDALGQQVVVDNRAGVGGIIGMEMGATAVPDGYTLIAMATAQVISPHLQRKLAYDTFRDFAPISLFGITSNVFIAHPRLRRPTRKNLWRSQNRAPAKSTWPRRGRGRKATLRV